ncbi:MAG TPA: MFS transporter [Pseudobdellovibrionaceae bacterium]|nr:MFS transporter [Pseudobdellovibrionaceae bacterium]
MSLVFFTVFLYLLGFGIIIPILPILSKSFGASALQTGLLMSVYSFMQFFFAPFWGKLSDKIGRRPILIYCLLGEGLAYILFAYARSWEILMLARALAGFFAASISTASAYISDITPKEERSKGMALIGLAFGLGFVVGPALGGQLSVWGKFISEAPHFDTTFTLLWVSALCLGTFLFAYFFLEESLKKNSNNTTDHKQEKKKRFQTLWQYSQKKHIGPLILAFGLLSIAMSAMESTLVLHVDEKFHWGIQEVSYGFAYIGLVMIFTQGFLVRRLIPLWGEKIVVPLGMVLFISGLAGIGLSPNIEILGFSMTLFAIGNGLTNPSLLGSISLLSAQEEQGFVLGVTQSFASLGRILGPVLGGFLFQKYASNTPFLVSSFMGLIGLSLVLTNYKFIPNSGKKQPNQHDIYAINQFQFMNLLSNRIPFLLLHLSGKITTDSLNHLEKTHFENVLQKRDLNWSPTEILKMNLNVQHPIVIYCENSKQGKKLCLELHKMGYTNAFYKLEDL